MTYKLSELAELVGGAVKGDPDTPISGYCSIDNPDVDSIAFVERPKEAAKLAGRQIGAIVTSMELANTCEHAIVVPQPKLAYITIIEKLTEGQSIGHVPGIHERAVVADDAEVDATASIGPGAIIEPGASIGPNSEVCAGAFVGRGSALGADCVIGPNVNIYPGVRIGDRVKINGGSTIGAPGFGFVPTKLGHVRFPQLGGVVIEDDVEIGSNCCVDRASLDDTVIHAGTKIDNLVQIAHGVELGENTIIAAQTGISGGTQIGKWCVVGGQAGFQGHITVGDQSIVAAQSGVFSDLPYKSKVSGYPAKPHAQSLKVLALTFKLPEMLEKIRSLEIEIEMLRGEMSSLRGGGMGDIEPRGEA